MRETRRLKRETQDSLRRHTRETRKKDERGFIKKVVTRERLKRLKRLRSQGLERETQETQEERDSIYR